MDKCSVKGCYSGAPAILGLYAVCGEHYEECMASHFRHEGNEWMEKHILNTDKCTVCGKEGGELRETSFSRTPDGEKEVLKHCPNCCPLNGLKGDFYNLNMNFG